LPQAGTYNLNGVQAVTYGRIRKTNRRGLQTNRKNENRHSKLNKLVDQILPQVQTNLNSNEILGLASRVANL